MDASSRDDVHYIRSEAKFEDKMSSWETNGLFTMSARLELRRRDHYHGRGGEGSGGKLFEWQGSNDAAYQPARR